MGLMKKFFGFIKRDDDEYDLQQATSLCERAQGYEDMPEEEQVVFRDQITGFADAFIAKLRAQGKLK